MRMPTALKSLDDKVLGRRGSRDSDEPHPDESRSDEPRADEREVVKRSERPSSGTGDGLREFLGIFYRVAQLVFFALAAVLVVGIVFVIAPTNPDNSIVEFVADLSEGAAGPFRDVFTVSDNAEREVVVNYGFAAVVYLVLGLLVSKLPGGKR
jgi:hypothetical protein